MAAQSKSVVVYEITKGKTISVPLRGESAWLTQSQISELFQTDRTVITRHIRNIIKDGELSVKSNVQKIHFPNSDKLVAVYNLDMIISVGYRVNSKRATQFRIWATKKLRFYPKGLYHQQTSPRKHWYGGVGAGGGSHQANT